MSAMPSIVNKWAVCSLLGMLLPFALADDSTTCVVNGIDFQEGKSYFQNSLAAEPFTFVQEFEGSDCRDWKTQNLVVKPDFDQVQCSDTPQLPLDTPELSTCPFNKTQMVSGAYSILVLSDNGDGNPFAYQRDFVLEVAPQQTYTYTPTIVVPTTVTPIVNITVTVTGTSTATTTQTTTVPRTTIQKTKTVTPSIVTSTLTKTVFTSTKVRQTISVTKVTKTVTATCIVPTKGYHDKKCKIVPTLPGLPKSALSIIATPTPRMHRFRVRDPAVLQDKAQFLAERDAYLREAGAANVIKRAPDLPTITITDPNTSDYPTYTSTYTDVPKTVTQIASTTVSTTVATTLTIVSGKAYNIVTITAPTPTKTLTKFTVARTTITRTAKYTITITTTAKPPASATACRRRGGSYW